MYHSWETSTVSWHWKNEFFSELFLENTNFLRKSKKISFSNNFFFEISKEFQSRILSWRNILNHHLRLEKVFISVKRRELTKNYDQVSF